MKFVRGEPGATNCGEKKKNTQEMENMFVQLHRGKTSSRRFTSDGSNDRINQPPTRKQDSDKQKVDLLVVEKNLEDCELFFLNEMNEIPFQGLKISILLYYSFPRRREGGFLDLSRLERWPRWKWKRIYPGINRVKGGKINTRGRRWDYANRQSL